jgi:hypothetical protein
MQKREPDGLRFALTRLSAFTNAAADVRPSSLACRRATADAVCPLRFVP